MSPDGTPGPPSMNGAPAGRGVNPQVGGGGTGANTPSSADGVHAYTNGVHVMAGSAETVVLGSTDPDSGEYFPFEVSLTTKGAGVTDVRLSGFRDSVEKDAPQYPLVHPAPAPGGYEIYSFASETIHLKELNLTLSLDDLDWQLESSTSRMAVFSTEVRSGEDPLVRLRKTFSIPEGQTEENLRHDMLMSMEVECLSDTAQTVILTHRGAVGIKREDLRFENRSLYVGTREEGLIEVERTMFGEMKEELPVWSLGGSDSLVWTSVGNKYFATFQAPLAEAGHSGIDWVAEITSEPLPKDAEGNVSATSRTVTSAITVTPETPVRSFTVACYLGPKSRGAFQTVKAYVDRGYDEQVLASYSMGMCSFMTFRWLTGFMITTLNLFQKVVINYGIAIIMLVMIVRGVLHPITKKGQVNMMRMQQQMSKIQPKVEEMKKRFANDKPRQSQEMMKIYQEAGVNPAGQMMSGCLPMMLQMPIWIALYTSLNFNIDMRHQPFFLWIKDLTSPDALITFAEPVTIPLLSSMTGPIHSFNLLPILVSIAMFAQQKLMPKPKPAPGASSQSTDQAAQMQKMMPFMTLFFGLLFYNMPSGLNLYIGTSSFFGMLEQMHIRKHIEDLKTRPEPEKKPSRIKMPGFLSRIKQAAQDSQQIQSNSGKPKKRGK